MMTMMLRLARVLPAKRAVAVSAATAATTLRMPVCMPSRSLSQSPSALMADMDSNILASASSSALRITRFGPTGFTVNGVPHNGSMLALGTLQLHWKVETSDDITVDSLATISALDPRPEILVIGTGDAIAKLPASIREHCADAGIALEVQDTRHAISTYNFLVEEGRVVVGAFIPPPSFKPEPVARKRIVLEK